MATTPVLRALLQYMLVLFSLLLCTVSQLSAGKRPFDPVFSIHERRHMASEAWKGLCVCDRTQEVKASLANILHLSAVCKLECFQNSSSCCDKSEASLTFQKH